jgi:hypothetical protein
MISLGSTWAQVEINFPVGEVFYDSRILRWQNRCNTTENILKMAGMTDEESRCIQNEVVRWRHLFTMFGLPDRKNGINLIPSRYHWDQLDAKVIVLDINFPVRFGQLCAPVVQLVGHLAAYAGPTAPWGNDISSGAALEVEPVPGLATQDGQRDTWNKTAHKEIEDVALIQTFSTLGNLTGWAT